MRGDQRQKVDHRIGIALVYLSGAHNMCIKIDIEKHAPRRPCMSLEGESTYMS